MIFAVEFHDQLDQLRGRCVEVHDEMSAKVPLPDGTTTAEAGALISRGAVGAARMAGSAWHWAVGAAAAAADKAKEVGSRVISSAGDALGAAGQRIGSLVSGPAAETEGNVLRQLVANTSSIANNGARFMSAARSLSAQGGLSAQQKLNVMMGFIKEIGFNTGKQGMVDTGAAFRIYSEDSKFVFDFVKETGRIMYGKFDPTAPGFYQWTQL